MNLTTNNTIGAHERDHVLASPFKITLQSFSCENKQKYFPLKLHPHSHSSVLFVTRLVE